MSKCAQLKDLVFLIVTVPKIFKIGPKLTDLWPKQDFFFHKNARHKTLLLPQLSIFGSGIFRACSEGHFYVKY